MRHLHAGNDPRRAGPGRETLARENAHWSGRQSLPLHRLRGDLSGGRIGMGKRDAGRGARGAGMRTAITPLELLEPKTLGTALRMLRDDGPLTPLAGCTDL